jgi:predicted 2-oxoglutarate/Fe(II)-dependent dioxygenase YbiX
MSLISVNSRLVDFIQVKNNVLPKEICKKIIKEYEADDWQQSQTFSGSNNYRVCKQLEISSQESLSKDNKRIELDTFIFNAIHTHIEDYVIQFQNCLAITQDTGYTLLKYDKNEFYKEHTDDAPDLMYDTEGNVIPNSLIRRKITIIIALNNNYKGGEISFFGDTYRPKITTGDALFFPSWHMFPHQVLPITKGTRYSLTTWVT